MQIGQKVLQDEVRSVSVCGLCTRACAAGSMTIEAVVVVSLTIGVLMAVMFGGFYLHDRCVLSGVSYEAAVWGAGRMRINDRQGAGETGDAAAVLGSGTCHFFRETVYDAEETRSKVSVTAEAGRTLPGEGVLMQVLSDRIWRESVGTECSCISPEQLIRRCRAVMERRE